MTTTKPAPLHSSQIFYLNDIIDELAERGFCPADDYDEPTVDYFAPFAAVPCGPGWLLVNYHEDAVKLTQVDLNGVIFDELRFDAPDGHMTARTTAALLAVIDAWS